MKAFLSSIAIAKVRGKDKICAQNPPAERAGVKIVGKRETQDEFIVFKGLF